MGAARRRRSAQRSLRAPAGSRSVSVDPGVRHRDHDRPRTDPAGRRVPAATQRPRSLRLACSTILARLTAGELCTLRDHAAAHGLASEDPRGVRRRRVPADGVGSPRTDRRAQPVVRPRAAVDRASSAAERCAADARRVRVHAQRRSRTRSQVQVKRTNAGAAFIRLTIPGGVNPELRNRERGGTPAKPPRLLRRHGDARRRDVRRSPVAQTPGRPARHQASARRDAEHGETITPEYLDYLRNDVQVDLGVLAGATRSLRALPAADAAVADPQRGEHRQSPPGEDVPDPVPGAQRLAARDHGRP